MTICSIRACGRALAGAALLLALTALLAACGSSSKGGSTTAASTTAASRTGASTTASATGPAGRPGLARLRTCLQQQGVTLPRLPGGGRGGPGSGFRRGGGFFSGLSSAQRARLRAAMQKCGARFGRFGRFRDFGGPDLRSPAFRRALTAYVACVRRNGFNLPEPNTSGRGPIFDPSKVNRQDPRFQAASAKCQSLLAAARPAPPGGAPPAPGQGG